MDIPAFLLELQGDSAITGLSKFIWQLQATPDSGKYIDEFLSSSTNGDEVLYLLARDKLTQVDLSAIYTFLYFLLQRTAEENSSFKTVGIHIVHEILQHYSDGLYRLLTPGSSASCVVAGLRCLTGMVMMGSVAATEILSHLRWPHINFPALANRRDNAKKKDIRGALVQFFISFLHIDDLGCLDHFLKLTGVLSTLFQDMAKDSCERITSILDTLTDVVVCNRQITKTVKVKIFSLTHCKPLLNLYEWRSTKPENKITLSETPSLNSQQVSVRNSIHRLMLSMLTDSKLGVLFQADNSHALRVISLHKPLWTIAEGRELVSKTIKACPELLRPFMSTIQPLLKPESSAYFFSIAELVVSIIKEVGPYVGSNENAKNKGIFRPGQAPLPLNIVQEITKVDDIRIRYLGLKLLLAVVEKANAFTLGIENNQQLPNCEKEILKNPVLNRVEKLLKNENLYDYWAYYVNELEKETLHPDFEIGIKALGVLLKLLLVYEELFNCSPLDKSIELATIMRNVFSLYWSDKIVDKLLLNESLSHVLNISIFDAKCRNPSLYDALESQSNMIIFSLLINIYVHLRETKLEDSHEIESIMKQMETFVDLIFVGKKLSPERIPESAIWLKKIPTKNSRIYKEFFGNVIKLTLMNYLAYIDVLKDLAPKNTSLHLSDVLSKLDEVDLDSDSNFSPICHPSFSTLIVGAVELLKEMKDENLIEYFSDVIEDYLHCLYNPCPFVEYLLSSEVKISTDLSLYLQSWVQPLDIKVELCEEDSLFVKLRKVFINKECPKSFLKHVLVSETDLLLVTRQLLLYLGHEYTKGNLSSKLSKCYLQVLNNIVGEISAATTGNDAIRRTVTYFIEHPFVLEAYNPFLEAKIFNEIVEKFVQVSVTYYDETELIERIKPFFLKTLANFRSFASELKVDFTETWKVYFSLPPLWNLKLLDEAMCLCLDNLYLRNTSLLDTCKLVIRMLFAYSRSVEETTKTISEAIVLRQTQKRKESGSLFEISEFVSTISEEFLNAKLTSNSEMELPPHLLAVIPSMENCEGEDNKSKHHLLLLQTLENIKKYYGKGTIEEKYSTQFFSKLIKLAVELIADLDVTSIDDVRCCNEWSSFCKQVLKHSFGDRQTGSRMFNCLTQLCKVVYANGTEGSLPLVTLFQFLRSHSEFVSVMLNPERADEAIKEEILYLQLALIERNKDLCEERHIPLLLGAYGTSRSTSDELILMVLSQYESNGCIINCYPLLWGKSVTSYFSIEEPSFIRKAPKLQQILALLDTDKIIKTALNFDMKLTLQPSVTSVDGRSLYDQRFLLPLFLRITESYPRADGLNLAEKGLVALGLAALSSSHSEVYKIGAAILRNMVKILQNSRLWALKMQWIWLIGVLGYGLGGKQTRIPSLIAHFMIKASQLLSDPANPMYKPVMNYLYLKPELDIHKIPELFRFFNSGDIERHVEERKFLLSLLASGIRSNEDFKLCRSKEIPDLLAAFIFAPTASTQLKILALSALSAMVDIFGGSDLILDRLGILNVLPLAVAQGGEETSLWVVPILTFLRKIWHIKTRYYSPKVEAIREKSQRFWTKKTGENKRKELEIESNLSKAKKRVCRDEEEEEKEEIEMEVTETEIKPGKPVSIPRQNRKNSLLLKSLTETQLQFVGEFSICLSQIVPTFMDCASDKGLSSCLEVLTSVIRHYDCVRGVANSFRALRYLSSDVEQMRAMIEEWVGSARLLGRLRDQATEEDEFLLMGTSTDDEDYKTKPLSSLRISKDAAFSFSSVQTILEDEDKKLLISARNLFKCLRKIYS